MIAAPPRCRTQAGGAESRVRPRLHRCCGGYLNNRYYDPALSSFVSVDPLVGKTGTPYLYANGDPSTLSDPGGLAANCASVDGGGCHWVRTTRQIKEMRATECLLDSACDGQELVDALVNSHLGGTVFGAIDVANQGDWEKRDGNWSPKDVAAAAGGGENLVDILIQMGADPGVARAVAPIIRSVGQRLEDDNKLYEQIDYERSFFERHAGFIQGLNMVLGAASLFGCVTCAVGAAILSTWTAVEVCKNGSGVGCGVAVTGAVLSVAGAAAMVTAKGASALSGAAARGLSDVDWAGNFYTITFPKTSALLRGTVAPLQDFSNATTFVGAVVSEADYLLPTCACPPTGR